MGLLASLLLVGTRTPAAEATAPSADVLWKFSLNQAASKFESLLGTQKNSSSSTPAIAPNGTICLGTFNGTFFAITPEGKEKWRFHAGREIQSSPAIAGDGTLYFGSRDHCFYALTAGGKLKWKFATGGWVDSSPAIAVDGTVYFGSWDKTFYALNTNGALKWKFATGGIIDSSPAIAADGTVYFGSHDKTFYALKSDGTVRWKFPTGGEITSSPAVGTGGVIYFSSGDGNLYALNPDGTEQWRYHSAGWTQSSPVVDAEGRISLGVNGLFVVVSKDGKKLWHSGSALPVEVAAAAVDGSFYCPLAWRSVQAVAANDRRVWQADLTQNVTASPTVDSSGILYVCAENYLCAIRPPGQALPPASSPWPMFRGNVRHTGRVAGGEAK